ncbi:MAG: sigma-70 family RNA polymerase sigma factor [Planctomycetes bacterium]|nr:sigma-70 family RNA polymerase sigma factor [Planctomycetota bacterium]
MADVTVILGAIDCGDQQAARDLLPIVYEELRTLAVARLAAERPGQTLSATALVHEAYVRMTGGRAESVGWNGRGHFFAAAAESMRRILVDRARRKQRVKHGGDRRRLTLDDLDLAADEMAEELLELHEALGKFAQEDSTKARLVELRYFAGLTMAQAAEALGISLATAERYWAYSRAWLFHEITQSRKYGGEESVP